MLERSWALRNRTISIERIRHEDSLVNMMQDLKRLFMYAMSKMSSRSISSSHAVMEPRLISSSDVVPEIFPISSPQCNGQMILLSRFFRCRSLTVPSLRREFCHKRLWNHSYCHWTLHNHHVLTMFIHAFSSLLVQKLLQPQHPYSLVAAAVPDDCGHAVIIPLHKRGLSRPWKPIG